MWRCNRASEGSGSDLLLKQEDSSRRASGPKSSIRSTRSRACFDTRRSATGAWPRRRRSFGLLGPANLMNTPSGCCWPSMPEVPPERALSGLGRGARRPAKCCTANNCLASRRLRTACRSTRSAAGINQRIPKGSVDVDSLTLKVATGLRRLLPTTHGTALGAAVARLETVGSIRLMPYAEIQHYTRSHPPFHSVAAANLPVHFT